MTDARIPAGLSPLRTRVLEVALAEVGTREKTGRNDGPVEKYMPAWARGQGLPYCAWFVGWCWEQALGVAPYGVRIGACTRLLDAARERAEAPRGVTVPALRPGDAFVILYGGGAGHTGFVLRVSADGARVNTVEGNWRNSVGVATRQVTSFAGAINLYGRFSEVERNCSNWQRGLIPAPVAGSSIAGTR
jgi:hypothetical protein